MNKAGTGTLTLGGANTCTGNMSVLAGTLQLSHSAAAQNSTVNILVNNGLQFSPGIGTFTLGGLAGANVLTLSDATGAAVTLSVGGNGASTTYSGAIGGNGSLSKAGSGAIAMTGANSYSGATTVDGGTLQVPGGSLSSPNQYVGFSGTGSLSQSGGSNALPYYGGLYLGYNSGAGGSYILSGSGLLSASYFAYEFVGYSGTGTFTQSSGTNSLGANAVLYLGNNAGGSGTYSLSNNGLLSANNSLENIGFHGTGTFLQAGGTNSLTANSSLYLGGMGVSGTYTLSGGLLSANSSCEYVLAGAFVQSGGTNVMAGSSGNAIVVDGATYNLTGGLVSVSSATDEYVGDAGAGIFTQSGGTNALGPYVNLTLGFSAGGRGTYSLNGSGILSANNASEVLGLLLRRHGDLHAVRWKERIDERFQPHSRLPGRQQRDLQPQRRGPADRQQFPGIRGGKRHRDLHAVRWNECLDGLLALRGRQAGRRRDLQPQRRRTAVGEQCA